MTHVRPCLLELRRERADLLRDQLERGLQILEVGAFGLGLLAAKVKNAVEAEFKSFHGNISLIPKFSFALLSNDASELVETLQRLFERRGDTGLLL